MATNPTPAPALTDEQISELTETVRADFVASAADPDEIRADHETFDRWYATVVARAKREERARIAGRLEAWAETHRPTSPYTEGRRDAAYRAVDVARREATQ